MVGYSMRANVKMKEERSKMGDAAKMMQGLLLADAKTHTKRQVMVMMAVFAQQGRSDGYEVIVVWSWGEKVQQACRYLSSNTKENSL